MKLRNKKTGEIKDVESLGHEKSLRDKYGTQITLSWNTEYENLGECRTYNSLAELNEEWEDAPEEPKENWYISAYGNLAKTDVMTDLHRGAEEIGNLFSTIEEAEKALKKLKAWHKLIGYWETEILGWEIRDMPTGGNWQTVNVKFNIKARKEPMELLDLLFRGEE